MRSRALSGFIAATVLVASPLLAGFAGTDVVVPLVGYDRTVSPGTSGAQVTLWLTNQSMTANALITVQLYTDGATTNPTATTKLVLGAGEAHTVADPLGSLFGLTTADGVLRLISTTEVLVAIHADADESGSTGATGAGAGFEGMPASFAIAGGQNTNLLGVAETSSQDYRFAAVETAGQAVTFTVSLKNDRGAVIASRRYDLPPHGALEHSVSDLSALPFSLPSGLLKVEVTAGGGSLLAYGMRTSRISENAAGFDMALADSLLVSPSTAVTALNALTGNVTLAGSQTITVTTTPAGGGETGGTIMIDTPPYTAGTGLNLANHQFSLLAGYTLPQGCTNGQIPAWNGTLWGCFTSGAGLPQANAGQTLFYTGSGWMATSVLTNDGVANIGVNGNLNLPNTASSAAGVINFGGSPFIHEYTGLPGGFTCGQNTFVGQQAGNFTLVGGLNGACANTAVGTSALTADTSGGGNTAIGVQALTADTSGGGNTAIGTAGLSRNTSGNNNIALGLAAGYQVTTGSYNIDIGNSGEPGEGNTIRLGDSNQARAFIAGIHGVTAGSDALPVVIDSTGQLGTAGGAATPNLAWVGELHWWDGPYSGGSYGFSAPLGVAFDGTHIWVANLGNNSVTELNAGDGSWVQTFSGGSYGLSGPEGVSFDGTHIWVTNEGNSVTEINAADGSWVRTLSSSSYGFTRPWGVTFDGTHIWVTNFNGNSVTELSASDGSWVRTLSGGSYAFNEPFAVAFDGTHIWVTNATGGSVTELDASDGSWVRTLSGGSYGFSLPQGVAFDGTHIWVANYLGNSVTELNAGDGSWVQTLSDFSYGLRGPEGLAFDGTHIWVTNLNWSTVTELNASDGSWVRTLSGGSYGFSEPEGVAFDGTHIWVANFGNDSVTEILAR
jgi:hypothetical protein